MAQQNVLVIRTSWSFFPDSDVYRHKSSMTAESVEYCRDLISTATQDLEAQLENIDAKLEAILEQQVAESDADAAELQLIKEERLSTEKSLQICAQLSEHINQIQLAPKQIGRAHV